MSIQNWPGGLIRKTPPTPAGPYQNGAAPGVWTLDQAAFWIKQGLWPIAGNVAPIAVFSPGSGIGGARVMEYVNLASTGNTSNFGNYALSGGQNPTNTSATSSSTRGLFAGPSSYDTNSIYYITIATTGNAAYFGSLTLGRYDTVGMSNAVRSVTGGGYAADRSNVLDYVTIASTGNSTDFGDSSGGFYNSPAGFASSTRGVFALGYGGPSNARTNIIEYITIASTGNSTDFGDLTVARNYTAGASNNTRGIWCGGFNSAVVETNIMDYITIASLGDATDFGDLTQAVVRAAAVASSTRLARSGGLDSTSNYSNVIDYVTIDTTGNAADFGDLTYARMALSACCSGTASAQPT